MELGHLTNQDTSHQDTSAVLLVMMSYLSLQTSLHGNHDVNGWTEEDVVSDKFKCTCTSCVVMRRVVLPCLVFLSIISSISWMINDA